MPELSQTEALLIDGVRQGEEDAWRRLIDRYEGRLLAFAESRLGKKPAAEDVVQETFIGFLNSLPNYDGERPLEGYLFAICAYKITDHLRREGRRPTVPLSSGPHSTSGSWEPPGKARVASSIVRSGERREKEAEALAMALGGFLKRWREKGDWTKIKCMELLFVRGVANKEVAEELGLSEQQVANFKFDFLARLKGSMKKAGLSEERIADFS